jgi:plasmid stabilization system protein ParE
VKAEPKVYYHRLVAKDVREALQYFQRISPALATAFRAELETTIQQAAKQPLRSHPVEEFRRINLRRFPYHLLFQPMEDGIRVMLVRQSQTTSLFWNITPLKPALLAPGMNCGFPFFVWPPLARRLVRGSCAG